MIIRYNYKNEYLVSLRIQSKCGKMRTRITPKMDTQCYVAETDCKRTFNNHMAEAGLNYVKDLV